MNVPSLKLVKVVLNGKKFCMYPTFVYSRITILYLFPFFILPFSNVFISLTKIIKVFFVL